VAVGLDYSIAWIFDMLDLFSLYRRVYISNTDTHTHTPDSLSYQCTYIMH